MDEPRDRFEMKAGNNPRDRRVFDWIAAQIADGRNVSELIKNLLDELITGRSYITGRRLKYQGDVQEVQHTDEDGEIADVLNNFGD